MAVAASVLIVEDDREVRETVADYLASHGYEVSQAADGAAMRKALGAALPDLVLLDVRLPGEDGLALARWLRERHDLAIIMLTAAGEVIDRVVGLEVGADDYIGKPFGMAELMARLRAALRHAFQAQGELPMFVSGDLSVDLVRRHVIRGGREIKLSPKEFELLRHLVTHAGKVLTHRQLLREVWGPAQAEEVQYLRVFIRGLRQKLEPDPTRPTHILTELGVGYRLQLPPEQRAPIT
jgi:two-component system, OmpR family, KDP operon response regulator KdpE